MKKNVILAIFSLLALVTNAQQNSTLKKDKQVYEWVIYSLKGSPTALDNYYKEALIPFYNRNGVKVGAFGLYGQDTPGKQYYLIVYPNMEVCYQLKKTMWQDEKFVAASKKYFDETAVNPVYTNIETFLCEAFDVMPQMRMPSKEDKLFEFRIYSSPNEEANLRKIEMFNNGEVGIFDEAGIKSVCYGEVLSGSRMPSLIYLTCNTDMTARDAAWDKFSKNPKWIAMRADKRYANTATNNARTFLVPLAYSQLATM